jgi:hypothetical protein
MSKAIDQKIEELYQAVKDLRSFDEIKPHCDRFNEWINQQNYSMATLGTKLSSGGFYKKLNSIHLEQNENAESVPKHDANGNITASHLKHYAVLLCGLDKDQWKERNESTRVINRLGNDQEVDPDKYLEVAGQLLESDDPHELAVGLIAATGRRPHEIIARAKFSPIEGESYQLLFEGQGKKRGDKPVFQIATLYPADYVIKCLTRLRRESSTKALLKEVANEFPNDLVAQNRAFDSRRGQSLRRVVKEYFGDKFSENPALELRNDDDQNNCKALRAAYGAIAVERDCARSTGSRMLHFAQLMGHFVKENPTDKELQALTTTLGYADYFVSKPVNFPPAPHKGKSLIVRASEQDFETIKELQAEWELSNQQAVISRLIESHHQKVDVAKELLEAKSQIAKLEKLNKQLEEQNNQLLQEKTEMETQPQQITLNATDLESLIAQEVQRQLQQVLGKMPAIQATPQAEETATQVKQPTRPAVTREKELTDWEGKTNEELWASKASGAANEKIRRSYEAICLYNDTLATGDNDRLAITNQALRELSGASTPLIGDWIKFHADEIISHNSKYGMQNSKDPSKTETYYNKRHGQQRIGEILKLVNQKFLDGQAKV